MHRRKTHKTHKKHRKPVWKPLKRRSSPAFQFPPNFFNCFFQIKMEYNYDNSISNTYNNNGGTINGGTVAGTAMNVNNRSGGMLLHSLLIFLKIDTRDPLEAFESFRRASSYEGSGSSARTSSHNSGHQIVDLTGTKYTAHFVYIDGQPVSMEPYSRAPAGPGGHFEKHADAALAFKNELCCPIGKNLFREPIIASDGKVYEKDNILFNMKSHSIASPLTRETLTNQFTEDAEMKRNVLAFIEDQEFLEQHEKGKARAEKIHSLYPRLSPQKDTAIPKRPSPESDEERISKKLIVGDDDSGLQMILLNMFKEQLSETRNMIKEEVSARVSAAGRDLSKSIV